MMIRNILIGNKKLQLIVQYANKPTINQPQPTTTNYKQTRNKSNHKQTTTNHNQQQPTINKTKPITTKHKAQPTINQPKKNGPESY